MLALFKSHFSIGKSILTLNDPFTLKSGGADSIFQIAKENNLERVILVEDSLSGFLQAKKVSESHNLQMVFGLRMDMSQDASLDPKKEEKNSRHKIIIFSKNNKGCKLLNQIYSQAFTELHNSTDSSHLKQFWNDDDLKLAIPFYDSFIYNNTMRFNNCTPDFSFTKPTFFIEDNALPFDPLIKSKVLAYASRNNLTTESAKSIYYKNKKDVAALQTYKCICGRTFGNKTLSKPNLDHFGSDEFCFESWKEINERKAS
jgi:DNA polymerase III alpha subunit